MPHPEPEQRDDAPPGNDWLRDGLTREEARAVTHSPGPLLLLAGPSAGRTRTLTLRIAHLIRRSRAQCA
jgi:DNA helicase-2/ATP-dependent DNA helicase PcrA